MTPQTVPPKASATERTVCEAPLVMLVPHEPTLDPRVHYTAASLSKRYEVMVLSVVQNTESCGSASDSGQLPYRTMRLPYEVNLIGLIQMAWTFIEIALLRLFGGAAQNWLVRKMVGGIAGVLLAVGLATMVPLLLVFEIVLLTIMLPVLLAGGILHTGKFVLLRLMLDHAWRRIRPVWWKHGLIQESSISRMVQGPVRTAANFLFALNVNAQLVRFCEETHVKADVIYCHDLYTLQAGCVLKGYLGARLIYDSHEYYPYLYEDFVYVHLIKWYESTLVRRVDVYMTVSPQLALELQRVYGVSCIQVFPNVEPYATVPHQALDSGVSRLAAGRLKVLYQGMFAEGRGLEEVLSEWKDVESTGAVLFLRGPKNEVRDRLEDLAVTYGLLGKSVFVLPPVTEKDLIGGAKEADLGLIPYKSDRPAYQFACPNKLSQYIHAGLAIVANKTIPFVQETVELGDLGFCYNLEERGDLARKINRLAHDRSCVTRLRANAEMYSKHYYNWERYEEQLLKIV